MIPKTKNKVLESFSLEFRAIGDNRLMVSGWLHSEAIRDGCVHIEPQPTLLKLLYEMHVYLEKHSFIENQVRSEIEAFAQAVGQIALDAKYDDHKLKK